MKYLRKFNESIREDIEDILLELKDIGFTIDIIPKQYKAYSTGTIFIEKSENENYTYRDDGYNRLEFKWEEIKDCVLRLKDYLGKNFISFEYTLGGEEYEGVWEKVDLNNDTVIFDQIEMVLIKYKPGLVKQADI